MKMKTALAITSMCFICGTPLADQGSHKVDVYDSDGLEKFVQDLYPVGGTTLYCGLRFDESGPVQKCKQEGGKNCGVTREHVYSAKWIANQFHCDNRDKCRGAGDLHNLWPAIGSINSSRRDLPFGEIDEEKKRRFTEFCEDYERTKESEGDDNPMVEPRDDVKGEIARSILYMMDTYRLPLPPRMTLSLLMKWHEEDPPDRVECMRNIAIADVNLQGTRNPWIGDEKSADECPATVQ